MLGSGPHPTTLLAWVQVLGVGAALQGLVGGRGGGSEGCQGPMGCTGNREHREWGPWGPATWGPGPCYEFAHQLT